MTETLTDYDKFVSENLDMLTKTYDETINAFILKSELITIDYLSELGDKIDMLENSGDKKELFIQSYLFERFSDYENINIHLSEKIKESKEQAKSNEFKFSAGDARILFTSIILEATLTVDKKRSLAYEKFLQYQEINKDNLSKQLIDYINNLKTQNKTIDSDLLDKLKEWCYKAFETDKFYSRLFLYQKVFKDRKKINEFLLDNSGKLTYRLTA